MTDALDRIATELPLRAGIGLRHPHHRAFAETRPATGWIEVHSENFMRGGPPAALLADLRRDYPVSLHGVGLSLGSAGDLDARHLEQLAALVERIEPALISEHVSWSVADGRYLNDLLPLPYTEEALGVLVNHIDEVQTRLGRTIAIENPSTYLQLDGAEMDEASFVAKAVRQSGCLLLLDVNNVYVSARNHGFDAHAWLNAMPADCVAEIHLAGHTLKSIDGVELRIDDHASPVPEAVWQLYRRTIERIGSRPTLIEWDADIPTLEVLLAEAAKADRILEERREVRDGIVAA